MKSGMGGKEEKQKTGKNKREGKEEGKEKMREKREQN